MTTTDLSRVRKLSEKKSISVSCAHVLYTDVVSTNTMQLFALPANALIVAAGVVVDTVANGAITVDFGFDGGNELGAALNLHSATGYIQAVEVATLTTLTGTTALTSGALTGTVTSLTGTVTALTLNEGTPNTLDAGTVALTSGALTGTVTTLTGTCTLTSGAGTVVHAPRIATLTGKTVTAVFSAGPTAGEFHFIVEYIEYTKSNGELTPLLS